MVIGKLHYICITEMSEDDQITRKWARDIDGLDNTCTGKGVAFLHGPLFSGKGGRTRSSGNTHNIYSPFYSPNEAEIATFPVLARIDSQHSDGNRSRVSRILSASLPSRWCSI